MTNDDAISKLKNLRVAVINDNPLGSLHGMYEAVNMAIEALKQQKTMPTVEQSMRNEFRLEVENSELRHQIEILKKKIEDGK